MTELRNPELREKSHTYTSCWLHHWEDALGRLEKIWMENGLLNAMISKIILILPPELEETLEPLLGQMISIIRTDIFGKEYLVRVIPEFGQKNDSMTAYNFCEDEHISNAVR